jgi:acetyl esterase/lipase
VSSRLPEPITRSYGPGSGQEGDLHLPARVHPPVVVLLHGGFWTMPHGREQMTAMAGDLAMRGLAVWNLEYRRLGAPGAGWPGTFVDVAAGLDHLAQLAAEGADLDLDRVAVAGHSAGGHLALWCGARRRLRADASPVRVSLAIGLAPIADLARAAKLRVGGDVVPELLGGLPARVPERYRAASPMEMLPLGVPQLILHGTADEAVPIELSRGYAEAARAAGDTIELVELPGMGHMDYLDPASDAHAAFVRRLMTMIERE